LVYKGTFYNDFFHFVNRK